VATRAILAVTATIPAATIATIARLHRRGISATIGHAAVRARRHGLRLAGLLGLLANDISLMGIDERSHRIPVDISLVFQ